MGTIYDPHCWNPRSPPTVRTATGHGNCTTTLSLEVHFIEAGMVYSVAACVLYLNRLAQRWLVALRHLLSQLLFFPKKKKVSCDTSAKVHLYIHSSQYRT